MPSLPQILWPAWALPPLWSLSTRGGLLSPQAESLGCFLSLLLVSADLRTPHFAFSFLPPSPQCLLTSAPPSGPEKWKHHEREALCTSGTRGTDELSIWVLDPVWDSLALG